MSTAPLARLAAPRRRSLAVWSTLALAMAGFSYVLTVLLAALCVYGPWLLVKREADIGSVVLLIFGVMISLTMLWSLIPRIDRFEPPGPRLDSARHPRLFAEIHAVAGTLSQPAPADVYLIADVNAWVAQRGGLFGFGSRRVMAVGLPLFPLLTVGELRAVLAHEFAHYYGGDTSLGQWVHIARMAMAKALIRLTEESPLQTVLRLLGLVGFVRLAHWAVVLLLSGYWRLFLRATNVLSRRQELRADELAALAAGSAQLASGLRRIEGVEEALAGFWEDEMLPALLAGLRPPFAEGFIYRLRSPLIAERLAANLQRQLAHPQRSSDDTHPPLSDRLAALASGAAADPGPSGAVGLDTPAATLLNDLDAIEMELMRTLLPDLRVDQLQPVGWSSVGERIYVERWRGMARAYASLVNGWTVADLPSALDRVPEMAGRIRDPEGTLLTREQRAQRVRDFLAESLALALFDAGWTLHARPGEVLLRRDGETLDPYREVAAIGASLVARFSWSTRAHALGIGELPLSQP
jgi:Zn-dependent protease with chaperone function